MMLSLMTGCVRRKTPSGTTATTAGAVTETSASVTTKVSEKTEETTEKTSSQTTEETKQTAPIDEDGTYDSAKDVALYIHTYNKLPPNYITKKEAKKLGWSGGSLEGFAPGKCIGGDRYGNFEGLLPEKKGRSYTECDIDTLGKSSRGAKRIVFSNDGLIYYTKDHYKTFTLMYGEEQK
ncbi:MAG: ribonuclease [Ruminococcaceae bacterium]|nr:ribonuclease [Oscillospiraceae bacterium]